MCKKIEWEKNIRGKFKMTPTWVPRERGTKQSSLFRGKKNIFKVVKKVYWIIAIARRSNCAISSRIVRLSDSCREVNKDEPSKAIKMLKLSTNW